MTYPRGGGGPLPPACGRCSSKNPEPAQDCAAVSFGGVTHPAVLSAGATVLLPVLAAPRLTCDPNLHSKARPMAHIFGRPSRGDI
jgi:hypothetical protein